MEEKIKLRVLGISYSQTHSGAYALILGQTDGPVRIPVVIGATEAKAIATRLENINTPRPLTHDLIVNITHAFGIGVKEVFIYKFEDGIFSSEITLFDSEREVTIDSRTSDAIAPAMRTGAPIYTTPQILKETGFVIENDPFTSNEDNSESGELPERGYNPAEPQRMPDPSKYSLEELEKTLNRLIEREEYEEAARIREIIRKKTNK